MPARKKRYRRHRRGRFGFLIKILTILAVCAAVVAALTLFFKVNVITVSGESHYTQQEILDASGVKTGDNLFLLNKFEVANRLVDQLPYIEEVRINRALPDQLLITVRECSATFAVEQNGTDWLISTGGKIVDSCDPAQAGGSPEIDGCELLAPSVGSQLAFSTQNKAQETSLLALMAALEKAQLLDQVRAIHLGNAAELTMDYADRFTVRFSYGADYAYKLRNLTAVVDALETNQTGAIDLTKDGEAHFLPN